MEHIKHLIGIVENLIEGIETQDVVLSAAVVVFMLQYLWLFCVWVELNVSKQVNRKIYSKQPNKDIYVKE